MEKKKKKPGRAGKELRKCGLCGSTTKLTKTECCGNWVCADAVDQDKSYSYEKGGCYEAHMKYTLCAGHFQQGHSGDWQTCELCKKSQDKTEMYVWFGTNEFNFEKLKKIPRFKPTCCAKCGGKINLGEDGFMLKNDEYFCNDCSDLESQY